MIYAQSLTTGLYVFKRNMINSTIVLIIDIQRPNVGHPTDDFVYVKYFALDKAIQASFDARVMLDVVKIDEEFAK